MHVLQPRHLIRVAIPQLLSGGRLVLAAAALVSAVESRLFLSASLIAWGGVLDGLDGWLARKLDAETRFGALFDYFCDYACFIIAPWTLARALLSDTRSPLQEAWLAVPLVTGAIRYARNGVSLIAPADDDRDLPGLGTVFFAFVCVAAVFLDARALMDPASLNVVLFAFVSTFSVMMIVPIRYPKLTRFRGASPVALVLLAIMPIVGTRVLAGTMLVLGVLYAAVAPLLVRRPQDLAHAGRDRGGGES